MMPWPGLLEPFTECFGLGLTAALCINYLLGVNIFLFLLLHTGVWFCCDLLLIKTIEVGAMMCVVLFKGAVARKQKLVKFE